MNREVFYTNFKKADNGCVEWLLSGTSQGYGRVRYKGKKFLTHRLMWEFEKGPIPEGMQVLHKCDNPSCANVDHLFLGTNQDNVDDKMMKGREPHSKRTHCKNGHEFTKENTRQRSDGCGRECIKCRKDIYTRYRERLKCRK